MSTELRNFLALTYDELEELNLQAKEQRRKRVAVHKIQEERLKYLTDEKRIKAVTVLFSDLVCRLLLEKKKTNQIANTCYPNDLRTQTKAYVDILTARRNLSVFVRLA